jgi:glutaredoxin
MQVVALFAVVVTPALVPQDPGRPGGEAARAAGTRSFFRETAVDFWGDQKSAAAKEASRPKPVQESIWAEPIRLPDGRMTVYLPPRPVLGFLENPTRESARGYLAWQEERAGKLKTAMELLREVKEERNPPAVPAAAEMAPEAPDHPESKAPRAPRSPAPPGSEILYFKKKDCPWCAREDEALTELGRSHPEIKVRTIALEEEPELARSYGVTVVPTLVVPAPRGRKVTLRGFVPAAQIIRVIEQVNHAAER